MFAFEITPGKPPKPVCMFTSHQYTPIEHRGYEVVLRCACGHEVTEMNFDAIPEDDHD
jgi:hypothetical protein